MAELDDVVQALERIADKLDTLTELVRRNHEDLAGEHGFLGSIEAELNAIAPKPGERRR